MVFLNTGQASPLTAADKTNFEAYFRKGGGFVGIGSAIESDPSWQFLTDVLGTRARQPHRAAERHGQGLSTACTTRARVCRSYWERNDHWYNFTTNVRGISHVLATVVEDPFGPQPQGATLNGIEGGTMGVHHPVSFCKDYQGGRSFYTALGNTEAAYDATLTTHLKGAITWATGTSDPAYSDCGATVLKNFQQTKVGSPPNLQEPIGFDQLPDGRVLQTDRLGSLRLHDPTTGVTSVIANFDEPAPCRRRSASTPRVRTASTDRRWTRTSPPTSGSTSSTRRRRSRTSSCPRARSSRRPRRTRIRRTRRRRRPRGIRTSATTSSAASSSSRTPTGPRLDFTSEQQIIRVPMNRQECCHVAGDIDFDKHGNLWLVTGDDTPAGGINAGGYGPFNSQKTDEQQTVRVTGATAGTFTLTFDGQTTAPIAYNATAAQIDAALEALSNIEADEIQTSGGGTRCVSTANVNVFFRRGKQQSNQTQITADGAGLTGGTVATTTAQEGGWYQRLTGDSRRSALNTNDLRGKVLRIKVKDAIGAADANKADFTGNGTGAYTIPAGNLYPLVAGAPQDKTRAEVYAMGFRNPFRIQVDENDVAYVSDYSPDAQTPRAAAARAASAASRSCASRPTTAGRRATSATSRTTSGTSTSSRPTRPSAGTPLHNPPKLHDCNGPTQRNDSLWNIEGGPTVEPGLREVPPVTNPDIWYSYRTTTPRRRSARRARPTTRRRAGPIAPGSTTECPRLFPELYTGGVGPHGMTKYEYDPANPNPKKFPAYYDDSVIFGEWTQDTLREMRLDGRQQHPEDQRLPGLRQPREHGFRARSSSSATTRWTCSSGPTARSTCSRTATGSTSSARTPACTSGSTSRASARRRPC